MIDNANVTLYNFTRQYRGTEAWKLSLGPNLFIDNKRK